MKDPDPRSPYAGPRPVTPPRSTEPVSVSQLIRELIAQARARAEADRAEAASRGPVRKLLLLMTVAAFLSAGATTIYGIYHFPDAPIRAVGGGYAGKGGTARTRQEYENYLSWTRAMWITYPATFLLASVLMWADDRGRRRRREAEDGPEKAVR